MRTFLCCGGAAAGSAVTSTSAGRGCRGEARSKSVSMYSTVGRPTLLCKTFETSDLNYRYKHPEVQDLVEPLDI